MIKYLDRLAEVTGKNFRESILFLGRIFTFLLKSLCRRPHFGKIRDQMFELGVCSFPLILLVSVFSGFIATLTYSEITARFHATPILMGRMVGTTIFIEIGPALVGLILSARVAARIAAQLGSMKVSEQLDAMVCLSLDPYRYVIQPRIIACFIMAPTFYVFSSVLAVIAAQILSTVLYGLAPIAFYNGMRNGFSVQTISTGFVKVITFTTINALIGCFFGFSVKGGAQNIGRATRNAVVASSVLILVANLIISSLFL
ncbi:ABC transporter permease [Chitinispirillales bacterium ANBcel5]|uniref:MlaE family ABC transporter permease n=1 Tax=Cellulosispirillum alkaliphilum TaxID=3039283 RepID=UPI002A540F87|nr:ABC transporter permease [Chitinispirillales bacterium ANBcel5]